MRDDEGRIYYIVHNEDVIKTDKTLGVSRTSAYYIQGDKDLLPEGYGYLHPRYQACAIFNDEGVDTGFSKIRCGGYPIVWEKMEKVEGRRFKKIKVAPEDAEEYFRKGEEDYRKYQEEYEKKKREGKYVVASTTHWEFSRAGMQKSVHKDLSVGRIDGAYYYSPDISEHKKRVSADSFKIICEIDPTTQDEARSIIRIVNDYGRDLEILDSIERRAKNLNYGGSDMEVLLRLHMQRAMREFVLEQREKCGKRIDKLMEELKELGTESEETGEVEEGSEQ